MESYLLGIDNGSTTIKAGVYDLAGTERGVCGAQCPMDTPKPGYYERDMEAVWEANVAAIRGCIKKAGIRPDQIAAVALTGHGNGLYPLDKEGKVFTPAIQGMDARAAAYVSRWKQDGTFDAIFPKTLQSVWPGLTIVICRWLKDNAREIYDRMAMAFTAKDYIRYRLTGEAYTEITDVSGGGLINTVERRIDGEMLARAGIAEMVQKIPPLIAPADAAGTVTPKAAQATGLVEGTPVAAGLYDIDAAGIATGMTDERVLDIIAGTWCNNQFISREPVVDPDLFSVSIYAKAGYYLMLDGSPTSASNLEWFVARFLREEARAAGETGKPVYEICNAAVNNTRPEETSLLFAPYLYGSDDTPNAKGMFVGLEGWHTREHVIRAIYEGICFSHKRHVDRLLKYRNAPQSARLAGGGAKSAEWAQMFADVLQTPVEITDASELGTLGAAACAAVGAGIYRDFDEACAAMVRIRKSIQPNSEAGEVYREKYGKWRRAVAAMRSYWEEETND